MRTTTRRAPNGVRSRPGGRRAGDRSSARRAGGAFFGSLSGSRRLNEESSMRKSLLARVLEVQKYTLVPTEECRTRGVEAHVPSGQYRRRHRTRFREDAQQEVSWSDVAVLQPVGFCCRPLQCELARRAERDLVRGRNRLAQPRPQGPSRLLSSASVLDFVPKVFKLDMDSGEKSANRFVAATNQAEQEMFGLDRLAAEPKGLIASEEQGAPCAFGVSVEHLPPPSIILA